MALYKLIDKQLYLNQEVRNVYWYESDAGGSADDLASAFLADVMDDIRAMQVDGLAHYEIEVQNVDDPADWHTEALVGAVGLIAGDEGAPFLAYSIKLNRTTRATRNGFKRLAGVYETAGVGGALSQAELTTLQAAADAMASDISLLGATYSPVIVSRVLDANGDIVSYETNPISSASAGQFLTTQNTRKRGRGA